jgi:hypothetical protein
MHRYLKHPLMVLAFSVFAMQSAQAASVTLRYGFKDGATYTVKQLYHDVGTSVTSMNMMGQQQTYESPMDTTHQGSWTAHAKQRGGRIQLSLDYGTQQGGERWGSQSGEVGNKMFADSSAIVTLDPQQGFVSVSTKPADDPLIDAIYRARLAWLPRFPEKPLKVGEGFLHEYTTKGMMMTVKSEDDYTLDEVDKGMAYFTIETRQVTIIDYSAMQPEGMPPGMASGMMSNMTLLYKGTGTAVFDLKEGIFIEREMKTAYSTDKPSSGMMSMSMRGTVRDRWEMERR